MKLSMSTQRLFLETTNGLCIRDILILYESLTHFIAKKNIFLFIIDINLEI